MEMEKKQASATLWKIIAAVCALIAIAIAGLWFYSEHSSGHYFVVDNTEEGVHVLAANAAKYSSSVGYVTIEEGDSLLVRSHLADNSSINIKVRFGEYDPEDSAFWSDDVILDVDAVTFTDTFYPLEPGSYAVLITAGKKATGEVILTSDRQESAG